MTKKILIILAVAGIILVGLGMTRFTNSNQTTNHGEMMGQNPAAQSRHIYTLQLNTYPANKLQPNQETKITYRIIDDQGNVLKNFAVDHTKLMHFILVRKDLQYFQHVHPDFNENTGVFTIPITFPASGTYRLFADFTPANGEKDPQGNLLAVTPYQDITIGDMAKFTPQDIIPDTQTIKTLNDYQITYALPKPIQSGKEVTLTIHVTKNGQPVTDMEKYLGAQAHGILLKKDSLDFAHLHAMGTAMTHMMNGQMMAMGSDAASKGPNITFTYTFPSSGVYKLFTQFQESGQVITSDYTFTVE